MIGEVENGGMIKRSGAKAGDGLFVTGTIGDGYLGLKAARGEISSSWLQGRYELPEPRVSVVPALRSVASSAMDISDGLIVGCEYLLNACDDVFLQCL